MKFGHASQMSDGVESWTCFPEVQRLNFGRVSQRSDGLEFGRASQRSIEIEFGRASQRYDSLKFGRASQRSYGLEGIIHTNVCGPFTLIPAK